MIKSNLPIFKFSFNAFCDLFKKSLPIPTLRRQICMFCSRRFMMLGFTFRSMMYLKLILCVCKVKGPGSFFPYASPVVPGSFVKKTSLSPLNGLDSFVKNQLSLYVRVYFWILFCSINLSTLREFGVGVYLSRDLIYLLNGSIRVKTRRGTRGSGVRSGSDRNNPGAN